MKTKTSALSSILLALQILPFASQAGLLRTPRVYNALVTSSENLTPSRAFPVLQPVLHETSIGYPLHHGYTLSPLNAFGGYGPYLPAHHLELQQFDTRFGERAPRPEPDQHHKRPPIDDPIHHQHKDIPPLPPTNGQHGPPDKHHAVRPLPPIDQDQELHSPLRPLDKTVGLPHDGTGKPNGLPPSLIPIQQYQIHDTIPYGYPGVPQLYYPYHLHTNFSPYPVLPPEFYRPPSSPQPPLRRRPPQHNKQPEPEQYPDSEETEIGDESKLVEPLPAESSAHVPPPPEDNGDNRNNAGKHPDVPDVPAPPPPVGKKQEARPSL